MNTPEMLEVLGCFQKGDTKLLSLMIINNEQRWADENWQKGVSCLRRMKAAAKLMEESK